MIIYDFECKECGDISEVFMTHNFKTGVCPVCGGETKKIVSVSSGSPVDAPWIKDVLEVVEKNSGKPHCDEFLKHPTRSNYQIWMRQEGLRPLEPGERAPKPDGKRMEHMKHELLKKYRDRHTITI